ncbi:MAG: beta-glucuronidase [Planctomycetota bacterium]|jgi:beta-glucuronidase|nr:beta-glucuronidase [Planctomycetota bacterium]
MLRTFTEHRVREVVGLDGMWDFTTAEDRRDQAVLPKRYARSCGVPQAWEQLPGLEGYRGQGWYRRRVAGDSARALRLVFGGVSHTADVYVDGTKVAHHYDAFTPFAVTVAPTKRREREVVVAVDNQFGDHSALHIGNDYYTYGGLTRPVEAHYVAPIYIERVHAVPEQARGGRWDLAVTVRLHNWSASSGTRRVVARVAGSEVELARVRVAAGATVSKSLHLSGLAVKAWSAAAPQLYDLDIAVYEGDDQVDDLRDRVGFRAVAVRGKKLLLNGKPLLLRGYNRHEDHPQFGCAIPVEAMRHDLYLLRDLGSNFVRTCHYPNDRRFLDLCDEMGFFVWEESHARAINFKHPRFREQIMDSTVEMLDWHRSHPSIIIWGCLNECDSVSRAGAKEHARVLKYIKKTDPSRPVTFASNKGSNDVCLGLVDIVAWNRYTGWYGGDVAGVEPGLKHILKWLHSPQSQGGAGKPVILSEFGGGAIRGLRDARAVHWTEEYQCQVLDEELRVYLGHPDVIGTAIWQFCDVRVTPENRWWVSRPRTMNNKGTVDEYRRPKMVYDVVKRRHAEDRKKRGGRL